MVEMYVLRFTALVFCWQITFLTWPILSPVVTSVHVLR